MKWAIFVPRYLPDVVGGNTKYLEYFSQAMVRQGHDVHIFTTTRDVGLLKFDVVNGVKIHRLLIKKGNAGTLRFSTTLALTKLFVGVDKKNNFDVLNPQCAFSISYGLIRKNIRIIHILHGVLTYEYLFDIKKIISTLDFSRGNLKELMIFPIKLPVCYIRESIALLHAEKVVVMSNYVAGVVKKFFPFLKANKLLVSRVGVDFNIFKPAIDKTILRKKFDLPIESVIFFTARRLVLRMGIYNLVKAVAKLRKLRKDTNFKLLIAGKGDLFNNIQQLIKKLDLESNVIMLGFVTDKQLVNYYQLSDTFVLPTEELEGFGLVSLEALACNIPVISTPAGANPEVSGLFCKDLMAKTVKVDDMVEKIVYFCDNLTMFQNKSYVDLIRGQYSWDLVVDELNKSIFKI